MNTTISQKQLYGLLGYPLIHSFSKTFFNEKFIAENIPAEYINFEIDKIELIKKVIVENPELMGLNVTLPYKEAVIPYMNEMDETARMIGAVNVIKFIREKGKLKLKGFNSDIIGFTDSIRPLLNSEHKKGLILGTGGASKAVWYGLLSLGITPQLVSRTAKKDVLTYEDLTPEIMSEYTVIINTTPLGMYPHTATCPPIPYEQLTNKHLVYDLIYNPDQTLFMEKASKQGAVTKNGLEMLLLQAFASWDIWHQ